MIAGDFGGPGESCYSLDSSSSSRAGAFSPVCVRIKSVPCRCNPGLSHLFIMKEYFILYCIMFVMLPVSFLLGAYIQHKISTTGFTMLKRKTKMIPMTPERENEIIERRDQTG